jgi:hypothetical protein
MENKPEVKYGSEIFDREVIISVLVFNALPEYDCRMSLRLTVQLEIPKNLSMIATSYNVQLLYRVYSSNETYRFLPFSFFPLGLHVKQDF